jgi:hypothetical protein
MKHRVFVVLAVILISVSPMFAQQVGRPDAARVGELEVVDTDAGETARRTVATELVQTLLIDDFETAGEWASYMPRDYGVTRAMRREGGPRELFGEDNRYVLGVKTEFMRRDWSWISINPARPTKVKGITKSLSVWVVGRNYRHTLSFVVRDYLDRLRVLSAERMIWVGWKKVVLNVPDTVEQENYKVTEERGLTFVGFRVDFNPEDMLGRPYYIYFDYLTADTDLFTEQSQNPDDMLDSW